MMIDCGRKAGPRSNRRLMPVPVAARSQSIHFHFEEHSQVQKTLVAHSFGRTLADSRTRPDRLFRPGGRAPEVDAARGAVADTPRLKVALITHAPAGDTFWDIVRKGAEAAAAKGNIDL